MKKILIFSIIIVAATLLVTGLGKQPYFYIMEKVEKLINNHPADENITSTVASLESIENYKTNALLLHQETAKIKSKEILTTITFTNPLTTEEITKFIEQYNITPKLIYVYGKEKNQNEYVTGGIYINEKGKDMLDKIKEGEEDITASQADLIGFISIIGSVPTEKIKDIQNDKLVYLADISADKYFGKNPTGEEYVQHLGYELYELKNK